MISPGLPSKLTISFVDSFFINIPIFFLSDSLRLFEAFFLLFSSEITMVISPLRFLKGLRSKTLYLKNSS